MADPINLVVSVVNGILALVKEAKTNRKGCQLLATLAEQTLSTLKQVENRELTDPMMTAALELVHDALSDAHDAIEECCQSNFFLAMVHRENYASSLKQAAEKLEHALSQVSVASVGMTADIQSELFALSDHIRHAKFNEKAEIVHQSKALMDALDRAFFQTGQGTEDVKKLIVEVLQQQSSSTDELRNELEVLKEHAIHACENKERQLEFELNQIIAAISESLGDVNEEAQLAYDLEDCLHCPISKEIMRDPVVLKDSCMIYDRSSITEWLRRGHRYDPLTKAELTSTTLVPNSMLRCACQRLLIQSGVSTSTFDNLQEENSKPQFMPGLYEGHGKLMFGSTIIHASQVLILEPSGVALGCFLYEIDGDLSQRNKLEIGSGEWDRISFQLSFGDDCYLYNGKVDHGCNDQHFGMEWTGQVSMLDCPNEKHDFMFVCSAPYVSRSIWARPGMLQMECDIISPLDSVKYNSKLVLALEVDSTIEGRVWFESASEESNIIGHIVEGSWDSDGFLTFKIEFSKQNNNHRPKTSQIKHLASFRVSGHLTSESGGDLPSLTARVVKVSTHGALPNDQSACIPLVDQSFLEYSYLRETSIPWYRFVQDPLHLFQISADYEMESGDYCVRADLDVGNGITPYYLHVAGEWSDFISLPLMHVSWHNSRVFDKPYWVRAAIWRIENTSENGGYKISLSENHQNVERVKDHVGKNMDVWQHQGPNRRRSECYLCVSRTSRIEDQCAWTLKRRHDGCFHLALETDRNPEITGGASYYLSHPVPKQDRRNGWSQYASLTRDRGKALRIILELPHQQ